MTSSGPTGAEKWRGKYLDLLDEHELTRKRYQDCVDILRRGLLQFSLELESKTPSIETEMADFRHLLRDEEWASIHRRLEHFTKIFEQYEVQKQKAHSQFLERLKLWEKEVIAQPLPKDEMRQLKQWRKHIKKRLDWEQDCFVIMGEVAALGTDVLKFRRSPEEWSQQQSQRSSQEPSESSVGFWNLLRTMTASSVKPIQQVIDTEAHAQSDNAHSPAPSINTQTAAEQEVEAQDAEPSVSQSASKNMAADRVQQTLTAMTEAMCRLISRIHFDQELHMRATALSNRLEGGIKLSELLPAFEEMVELIMSVIGTKQEAFQHFLKGFNQRLDVLQNLVKEAGESQGTFSHEVQSLSESIQQQMQELRTEFIKNDQPTASLKDRMLDKIDGLMSSMQDYLVKGKAREQRLSQQLEQLNHQVQSLEQQAINADKQLEEQQQQALIDPLTKVPNRQAYIQRIEQEYLRFKRYGNKLVLLVVDIDHFKNVNDTYGHLAGDKVLQLVARTIQKALRDTDFIARYGGEEFVILLHELNQQQAEGVAEKIRALVAACPFRFKNFPVTITLSLGGSFFRSNDNPETVFERADKAMYQCKHTGRNRWLIV